MTIDYTKLLAQIVPQSDGEDVIRWRTGVIDTVNSDGTVDVAISGLVIPDLPRLASTALAAGDVVQIASYRGALIIIDRTATSAATMPRMMKTGSTTTGPAGSTSFTTAISFGVTFPGTPNVHVNASSAPGTSAGWHGRAINITTTGFTLVGYGVSATFSIPWQWTAIYLA